MNPFSLHDTMFILTLAGPALACEAMEDAAHDGHGEGSDETREHQDGKHDADEASQYGQGGLQ